MTKSTGGFMVLHRSGYIGNRAPQKNCSGCSKNGTCEKQVNDYEEQPLYPAGSQEQPKGMTEDKLRHLQDAADAREILLPTGFNQSFERKIKPDDEDDNFLMPLIYK